MDPRRIGWLQSEAWRCENENAAEGKGVDNVPEESETEDADASDGDGSDDASDANGSDSEADEVAEAILWLAGEESSYVTGTHLDVTGGR